jgi:hypothetical protein
MTPLQQRRKTYSEIRKGSVILQDFADDPLHRHIDSPLEDGIDSRNFGKQLVAEYLVKMVSNYEAKQTLRSEFAILLRSHKTTLQQLF